MSLCSISDIYNRKIVVRDARKFSKKDVGNFSKRLMEEGVVSRTYHQGWVQNHYYSLRIFLRLLFTKIKKEFFFNEFAIHIVIKQTCWLPIRHGFKIILILTTLSFLYCVHYGTGAWGDNNPFDFMFFASFNHSFCSFSSCSHSFFVGLIFRWISRVCNMDHVCCAFHGIDDRLRTEEIHFNYLNLVKGFFSNVFSEVGQFVQIGFWSHCRSYWKVWR